MNKLAQQLLNTALAEVTPAWHALFTAKDQPFHAILTQIFRQIKADLVGKGVTDAHIQQNGIEEYLRPAPQYILGAFRYANPEAIQVIILGEDPYPAKGVSDGMAFSMCTETCANIGTSITGTSLDNIVKCLLRQELITQAPDSAVSLAHWAEQGVLLLNRYLTRTPEIVRSDKQIYIASNGGGKTRNLHQFWATFTEQVLNYLLQKRAKTLCVFGMGNATKATLENLEKVTPDHPEVPLHCYWWNHPSPRSTINNNTATPEHFVNCPHFTNINN